MFAAVMALHLQLFADLGSIDYIALAIYPLIVNSSECMCMVLYISIIKTKDNQTMNQSNYLGLVYKGSLSFRNVRTYIFTTGG